jgi:dUTP pyrophosphatase
MSNSISKLCRGCWRVINCSANNLRDICISCSGFLSSSRGAATKWATLRKEVLSLLWSVFNHCEIQENSTIDGVSFEWGQNLLNPIFDFVIPEYRLALDFISENQVIPWKKNIDLDHHLRQKFNECKETKTRDVNYRWVTLPHDLNIARNNLISYINEFYVLQKPHGVSLLTPKLQGDAGWDILCDEDVICPPQQGTDIPSDLFLEIPNHLYAIVQARSSTSKKRLLVLPGVIDPGYRGRIFVMSYNLTNEPITIKKGDRIAQMLFFYRVPHLHMQQVMALRNSQRGHSGFGSTG